MAANSAMLSKNCLSETVDKDILSEAQQLLDPVRGGNTDESSSFMDAGYTDTLDHIIDPDFLILRILRILRILQVIMRSDFETTNRQGITYATH